MVFNRLLASDAMIAHFEKVKSLQHLIYPLDSSIHRFDVANSYYAFRVFRLSRGKKMDWLYILLILAFFGLSVLLTYGIEKLGRPS